jgi:hypothetical protein
MAPDPVEQAAAWQGAELVAAAIAATATGDRPAPRSVELLRVVIGACRARVRATLCPHLAARELQPQVIAAWAPGACGCVECGPAERHDPSRSWLCDGCQVVDGDLAAVPLGALVVLAHLCRSCWGWHPTI